MFKLVIEDDEGKRTVVPLSRDDYSIGRKEGNTIRLTERNVSREHVRLHRKKNGSSKDVYLLEDLESYNGVYVNGLRVAQEQELSHGDLIQIGDYRILYQDESAEQPTPVPADSPDAKTTIPMGQVAFRGSLLMERPDRLVMLVGPTPSAEFPLDRDRLTIGRAEDASISINHNSVSRLHCEVHALGEGRYEIVDKGSANGVRVNGVDLRRGIIEPGDLIELGDVRFKFVGAGQVFVPNANESQQLAIIGDREAPDPVPERRGGGVLTFAVAGAVVALAILAGIGLYMRRQQGPQPTPIPPGAGTASQAGPTTTNEASILEEASKACTPQDCEASHVRVTRDLRDGSPLRSSQMFIEIEQKWADSMLDKAERETDVAKKKDILSRVAQTPSVDAARRGLAQEQLKQLDAAPAHSGDTTPAPSETTSAAPPPPATASATSTAAPTATTTTATTATATATGKPTATTTATAKPTAAGGAEADIEKARELMVTEPNRAKQLLWPHMAKGNSRAAAMLVTLCKRDMLNDKNCLQQSCKVVPTNKTCVSQAQ